jgi:hypothetical protein
MRDFRALHVYHRGSHTSLADVRAMPGTNCRHGSLHNKVAGMRTICVACAVHPQINVVHSYWITNRDCALHFWSLACDFRKITVVSSYTGNSRAGYILGKYRSVHRDDKRRASN